MAAFRRNQWPAWLGITGRFASEYAIETTLRFYAGLEGIAAARHYDAMLQELITPPPRPRRRA